MWAYGRFRGVLWVKKTGDSVGMPSAFSVGTGWVSQVMMMRTHFKHVLSSCFSALGQIKSTNRSLPAHAHTATLVTALVHSRLDYCNVVFAGLPNCDIQRLQCVLNTAVRLVAGASRWDHVTRLLRDHHWLPVKQRIEYKLCMTVHRCLVEFRALTSP